MLLDRKPFFSNSSHLDTKARFFSSRRDLTHVDSSGTLNMVQVGGKGETFREARASGKVFMAPETIDLISHNQLKKGDVLTVAKIAGISGAKQTSSLIPLCHPISLTKVDVNLTIMKNEACINIEAYASCYGRTGVEMEALMAVSTAACTIFDMCKAVDKYMVIEQIRVIEKKGGKSGHFQI